MHFITVNFIKKFLYFIKKILSYFQIVFYLVELSIKKNRLSSERLFFIGMFFLENNFFNISTNILKKIDEKSEFFAKKNFYLGSYVYENLNQDPKQLLDEFFYKKTKIKRINLDYYPPKIHAIKINNQLNFDEEINNYVKNHAVNAYSDSKQINIYKYYQSEHDIHKIEKFKNLKIFIENTINNNFKEIYFKDKIEGNFVIEKMWFVKSSKGVDLLSHNHSEGVLSGIFYYQVPENENPGHLEISNPKNNITILDRDKLNNIKINKSKIIIKPKKNALIFFSSYLKHSVKDKLTNEDRISIPFDMVFKEI